jgi:hypothetical protein
MRDLTFPKGPDNPPFQTWDQITRKIGRGDLTEKQQAELSECLWLDQELTTACLAWVRGNATHAVMCPLFAFAAFAGARRSEMIRSEQDDWDFRAGLGSIRQNKADRSKTFTRRHVPLYPTLAEIM